MTPVPEIPELAMPIGLPAPGVNAAAHYANLAANLAADVPAEEIARIWVADDPQFSGVHAMVRAAVRYYPVGSSGPSGSAVTTNTMLCRTWLWEYLSLKLSAGVGALVPAAIQLSNLEEGAVTALIRDELNSNPRYAARSSSERTQMETDFLAGALTLLVSAGTALARGDVDTAPPRPELSDYRRVDLAFIGSGGATLTPSLYFDIWRTIGGAMVVGHPLLVLIGNDVWPGSAPVEGGTRIRIDGENFTADTTVTVGGMSAANLRVAASGGLLHATLPPGASGTADLVVSTPGQPDRTITSGIRYVTDVVETARAVSAAFVVHLAELLELAQSLAATGTLDGDARRDLRLELELAHRLSHQAIDDRAIAGGGIGNSPGVVDALIQSEALERSLLTQVIAAIG